jgi:Asp-tRNA(Asn)/Glu-tRNA(Gln) amidotransferase A subunit family amidase
VQIIGRPRHDAELFMLARSLEQALEFDTERRSRFLAGQSMD